MATSMILYTYLFVSLLGASVVGLVHPRQEDGTDWPLLQAMTRKLISSSKHNRSDVERDAHRERGRRIETCVQYLCHDYAVDRRF